MNAPQKPKPTGGMPGPLIYALAFGLFLGLCILKFGNPVILDQKITPPTSLAELWDEPWPTHWAIWFLLPLALAGLGIAIQKPRRWPASRWLWLLPLLWFGWQLFSATQTVDSELTEQALGQFCGCLVCFFIGAFVLGTESGLRWLLAGVLVAFTVCLVRAVDQRLFEFPASHQLLVESQQAGWTNLPPKTVWEMQRDNVIITTNGLEVANPAILAKFAKGRVNGTLVYPNALAGLVILLFPVSIVLVIRGARRLRPAIRIMAIGLVLFLGLAGFFWTGSKLGWLIALFLGGLGLFRLKWSPVWKWTTLALVLVAGLGVFAIRFHHYFANGATSVGARFDYWRAAGQTTLTHPWLGTGPGTFQRPYAQLKAPDSEMARLTHNDYLEQFSDSGVPGGILYGIWIVLALGVIGRRLWSSGNIVSLAIFFGLLGWFLQGFGEFSLYIPALAWTAFALLGAALTLSGNEFDKKAPIH